MSRSSATAGKLLLRRLKNFQIVNGGQTTASIHMAQRNKVNVSLTFVQMKALRRRSRTGDPDGAEDLRIRQQPEPGERGGLLFQPSVPCPHRRVFAPHPRAESRDGTFRESKWYYERARGQYADARARLTPAQRRKFDLENPRRQLLQQDRAREVRQRLGGTPARSKPRRAEELRGSSRGASVREWKKSWNNFNEGWYREAIAKAIVFKATERLVSDATLVPRRVPRQYRGVCNRKDRERHLGSGAVRLNFRRYGAGRPSMPSMEEGPWASLQKQVHDVLISPPPRISNVTEWAKKEFMLGSCPGA